MAARTVDLYWLAGVLEGEGTFGLGWHGRYMQPWIRLAMSDRDVVFRAAQMLRTKVRADSRDARRLDAKQMWSCSVTSSRAIQWMMTLWILLGNRRRKKIRSVLEQWRAYRTTQRRSYIWGSRVSDRPDKLRCNR